MKNYFLKFYIILAFLLMQGLFEDLNAQDDTTKVITNSCSQKLREMVKNYEQGYLDIIPNSLQDCMNSGFTSTEKLQAYRLIILTYLYLDENQKASEYMNMLLKYEPDYKPNRTLDPIEFINLYNKFNINPYISFGIGVGANQTRPLLINDFSAGDKRQYPSTYQNGISYNFSAYLDVMVVKNLFFTTEFQFLNRSFTSKSNVISSSDNTSNEIQSAFVLPLTFKYMIGNGNFKPYLRAGFSPEYLISSNSDIVRVNKFNSNQNDYAGPNTDLSAQRNKLNFAFLAGVGAAYKLGYGYLFLDIRYLYGISNYNNVTERYKYFDDQVSNYGYISNDFKIDQVQASFGYMKNLYKVKTKRNKQTVND